MTFEEFLKQMQQIGYSKRASEALVWVASSPENLTQAPFNLLAVREGVVRIYQPDGRAGYFAAVGDDQRPFEGTVGEAYEYIYKNRKAVRSLYSVVHRDSDD